MSTIINTTRRALPDHILMSNPDVLAKLWEHRELRERLDQLEVIAEHIDMEHPDLAIIAWEKLQALTTDLETRAANNLINAKKLAVRIGLKMPSDDDGLDAIAGMLSTLDLTDHDSHPLFKVQPAQHLACNIGVIRAGTVVKVATSMTRSAYATSPVTGVLQLVSMVSRHLQALDADLLEHESELLASLADEGFDVAGVTLAPELMETRRTKGPYWKVNRIGGR